MLRRTTAALVLVLAASAAHAQSRSASDGDTKALNLSAYVELLRSDIRTQKVAIITEVMGFTPAEDAAFWPIYREYDVEMAKLGDERVALIAEYAKNFSNVTDAVAGTLAGKAIDLDARRHAATGKCYERVKAALSPRTALRFLQVEHQLQLLIDLQVAALLPIASAEERQIP
jgi:hypothetical protein